MTQKDPETKAAIQPSEEDGAVAKEVPSTQKPSKESLAGAFKFFGLSIIIAPVGLGLAFLCLNMAVYNHARLPNPVAFVMMIVTGAFALLLAIASPGALCGSTFFLIRTIIRTRSRKKTI